MLTPLLLASALLTAPQNPPSQFKHLWRPSFDGAGETGAALCPAGDWDLDGVDDYAVGRPDLASDSIGFEPGAGGVTLVSGATGSEIATFLNVGPGLAGARLGASLAGPFDSDGDGLTEIAVGAPGAEQVVVLETDGAFPVPDIAVATTLFGGDSGAWDEIGFGTVVANVGDLDGDGRDELAVGAPESNLKPTLTSVLPRAGLLRIYDGDGLAQRRVYDLGGAGQEFGTAVCSIADLDGDGLRDLAVGAPGFGTGEVYLIDYGDLGLFGSPVLSTLPGTQANERFGSSLADLGDLNGGGASELLVGAENHLQLALPPIPKGRVAAFRLEDGVELWERIGEPGGRLGASVAAVDLDDDGLRSAALVDLSEDSSVTDRVLVLDGFSGDFERDFPVAPLDGESALVGGTDVDGDGAGDLLIGLPDLEFATGGVLAQGVFLGTPGGGGQAGVYTVDDDGPADFDSIQAAAIVVESDATLLVEPGTYDSVTVRRPLAILGRDDLFENTTVPYLFADGPARITVAHLTLEELRIDDVPGRATFSKLDVTGATTHVRRGLDVVFDECHFSPEVPEGFQLPGPDGIVMREFSYVRLVDCLVEGGDGPPYTADGGDGVVVAETSFLWSVGSTVRGGDGSDGEPEFALPGGSGGDGVRVTEDSYADLRGTLTDLVEPGLAGSFGAGLTDGRGLRVDGSSSARVSSALPAIDAVGPVTFEATVSPWLDHESVEPLGGALALDLYAPLEQPGALVLSFGAANLIDPNLFGTSRWVDLGQAFLIDPFFGSGGQTPTTLAYPVPADPALVGFQVHVQAFTVGQDAGFDLTGTNGGAITLRD